VSADDERDSSEPVDSGSGIVHEYDGIIEQDNSLPRWWLATLYGAIVFAAGYWIYFHTYDRGRLPSELWADQKAAAIALEAERIKEAGEVSADMLLTLQRDAPTVAQGKEIYDATCTTCHDVGGRGKIGPNLTDDAWLHGGDALSVYRTVRDGYLPKQMPAWQKTLGEARVRAVTAYVLTLRNTNAAGGKAPQGEAPSKPSN
jgi:cytochrome c oxidase cbb3-type subunit 3